MSCIFAIIGGHVLVVYILNFLSIPFYAKIFDRRNFCIIVSLQLFLILALRADLLGVDLELYSSAFGYISHLDILDLLSRLRLLKNAVLVYPYSLESGWVVFNWLVAFFKLPFHIVLVICAAINMYAYGKLVNRYSEIPWMSYCILLGLNTYTYMFGILRQSLAMSLIILAVMAYDNNRIKAFFLCFVAFTIHRTAILAVVFFYILQWKPTSKKMFQCFMVAWIPFMAFAPFIYEKVIRAVMKLLRKGYEGVGLQWNYLMILLLMIGVLIVLLYSFDDLKNPIEILSIWTIIPAIYLETFGMMNDNLARSVQYFIVFVTLVVPQVLNKYFDATVVRLGKAAICVMLFAYMIVSLNGSAIVPYYTIFQ